MAAKSFVFEPSWMTPLEHMEVESRWKVMKAVVEYAASDAEPEGLSAIESVSFDYIRTDIHRLRAKAKDLSDKRRAARMSRKPNTSDKTLQTPTTADTREEEQEIKQEKQPSLPRTPSLKEKEINKEKEEEREGAPSRPQCGKDEGSAKGYPDAQLVEAIFDPRNQARLEAMAMQMRVGIERLRQMADDIAGEWTITGKTHTDYGDASSHLIAILRQRASEERREMRRGDMPYGPPSIRNGTLG